MLEFFDISTFYTLNRYKKIFLQNRDLWDLLLSIKERLLYYAPSVPSISHCHLKVNILILNHLTLHFLSSMPLIGSYDDANSRVVLCWIPTISASILASRSRSTTFVVDIASVRCLNLNLRNINIEYIIVCSLYIRYTLRHLLLQQKFNS